METYLVPLITNFALITLAYLSGVLHKRPEDHPLSIIQRMRMARHCALGFAFLHKKGIMHRDVKSMNILVTDDYACKITDFGCSKLVGPQMVFL